MSLTIPVGWISVDLAEILEPRSSRVSPSDFLEAPYIGLEHVEAHTNKLLGTVPAGTMSSSAVRFYANDVLYGRMRPYLNKVICPPFDGLASAEFIVFPDTGAINQRFLLWRLSANDFVEFACGQYEGDRPRVKFDQLAKFRLHLPPVAEQKRIVEKIEELFSDLDDGIAELKVAQKKLVQYRQSLLKAAVEGSLTAEWREAQRQRSGEPKETGAQLLERILTERRARWEAKQLAKFAEQGKTAPNGWRKKYVEPTRSETAALPSLPLGWTWACAEQVCDFITKGTTPPKAFDDAGPKTVPFIRVTNLTATGALDLTDKVFISEQTHKGFLSRSIVYPCDVLMNIVGPPLGQVSIVPSTYPEWNINQAIAIFRPLAGVSTAYLSLVLFSPFAKQWLATRAKTTAGQTNLTLELCRALPISLPPVNEQATLQELVDAALGIVNGLAEALMLAVKQAAAQRQNILKAAFSGQLVPQDPNDEPANMLLERIRAERAATGGVTSKRASGRSRVRRVSGVHSSRERP